MKLLNKVKLALLLGILLKSVLAVDVLSTSQLDKQSQITQLQQQALTYFSNGGDLKQFESKVFLGVTIKGNLDVVEASFLQAHKLAPERLDLSYFLAATQVLKGDLNKACQTYLAIESQAPNYPLTWVYEAAYANAAGESATFANYLNKLKPVKSPEIIRYREALTIADDASDLQINVMQTGEVDGRSDLVILVLGYALHNDGSMDDKLIKRLEIAQSVATHYPNAKIIVSGGVAQSGVTESFLMRNWLIDKGIKPENVIVEDKSIDTVSNALNSMILIKNLAAKQVILVTSASHIRRATAVVEQAAANLNYDVNVNNVVAWDWGNTPNIVPATSLEKALIARDTLRTAGLWQYPGMLR